VVLNLDKNTYLQVIIAQISPKDFFSEWRKQCVIALLRMLDVAIAIKRF